MLVTRLRTVTVLYMLPIFGANAEPATEALRFLEALGLNHSQGDFDELERLNHDLSHANGSELVPASKSLLQKLFVGHLRVADDAQALPVTMSFGNRHRCANVTEFPEWWHQVRMNWFFRFFAITLRRKGDDLVCLEWEPALSLIELARFGFTRCVDQWTLIHVEPHEASSKQGIDNVRRQVRADIRLMEVAFPALGGQFDLIFCRGVLEHVEDPFAAMRQLAFLLSPGGVLYVGSPFLQQWHGGHFFNYPDFWRTTSQGLMALSSYAGLQRVALNVTGWGHAFVVSRLLGFGFCEFGHIGMARYSMGGAGSEAYEGAHLLARKHPTKWKQPDDQRVRQDLQAQRRLKGA